jgi:sugar lactone lactonase YvrE
MKIRHFFTVLAGMWLVTNDSLAAQVYTFGTLAGTPLTQAGGYADGLNSAAQFDFPYAVAVDSAGTVYVADTQNNSIRRVTGAGNNWGVTTVAGAGPSGAGYADGINSQAQFTYPFGVAVDSGGNLYVADTFNFVIRQIKPQGSDWVVSTIAGEAGSQGTDDGSSGSAARFVQPFCIAVDALANVYVADNAANTIRKLTPFGNHWKVSTIAGSGEAGHADGTGSQAQFDCPGGIAVDKAGTVFVSDMGINTGLSTIRRLTPVGDNYVVTTLAAKELDGSDASFSSLGGIAVDSATNLYVADAFMIRKITPPGANWVVTTIAGSDWSQGWADGTGGEVRFSSPLGLAVDSAGNLYVADSSNHVIRIGVPPSLAAPSLQLGWDGNSALLSWPLSAPGYVPETRPVAAGGGAWMALTNGVIAGSSFVVTNSPGAQSGFYRLHRP